MSLREHELPEKAGYVVATGACLSGQLGEVGGKAVGLGKLIRAGQRVPSSFVVTASAYFEHVRSVGQDLDSPMPASIRAEIDAAYAGLCESRRQAEVTVAVRSSATIEDTTEASCAGQFRTFLGARGTGEVVAEVERCFMSAFAPNVASYRSERQIPVDAAGVAVIVQELVDARSSGVMFTRHPRTGDRSLIVIESSYGLGEAVVGGEVTPDLIVVNKVTGQVHDKVIGSKLSEHRLSSSGRAVELQSVADERRSACSITEDEIVALVQMATALEGELGKGLDIEWAIGAVAGTGGSEELFALQVRPITVDPGHKDAAFVPAASASGRNPIDQVLGRLSGRRQ